jgi:radical SAM superfamily enzyme YgiQ (UPF0313 family)
LGKYKNTGVCNLVLVNPALPETSSFNPACLLRGSEPAHGLFCLSSILKKHVDGIAIIDAEARRMNNRTVINRINALKPRIVGFSSVTRAMRNTVEIAQEIKKKDPRTIIVIGGVHLSSMPEETLKRWACFDFGIIGEAEYSFASFASSLLEGNIDTDTGGLVYRNGDRIIQNPAAHDGYDINRLPFPDYENCPGFKYIYMLSPFKTKGYPSVSLVLSRGCPFSCSFCSEAVFGRKSRLIDPAKAVALIEHLWNRFKIRNFFFQDDVFFSDENMLNTFLDLLLERSITIKWSCHQKPEIRIPPDTLKKMRTAGCWQICYGIESCIDSIRKKLGKRVSIEIVKNNMKYYKQHRFSIKAFFMIGLPGETKKLLWDNIRQIVRMPIDEMSLKMYIPYPGTAMTSILSDFGTYNEFGKSKKLLPEFIPDGFSRKKLKYIFVIYLLLFYLRPIRIFKLLFKLPVFIQYFCGLPIKFYYSYIKPDTVS